MLRYIRDNKTLGITYYADKKYENLSYLLRQSSINNENQLTDFSDYSWQYCLDNGRSTGAYIIFYQGVTIYPIAHITVPVSQSSGESEYISVCTSGKALAHFSMLIYELLNKDPDIVP